jgi:glycosyltransferase involved in cell wall biosynthesis
LNIAFYCAEGSQSFIFYPPDVLGRGVGGAELSLITLTETLAKLGHSVTIYNQPPEEGIYNGVEYIHTVRFDPYERYEIFVLYRNPYELFPYIQSDLKLFFSCDQQTANDYKLDVFPFATHTICISEYHKQYFVDRYGVDPSKITAIDLGVRTWEYDKPVRKIPNSLLFCSIPDRGLEHLARFFPLIKQQIPDATLNVTSSYALWGYGIPDSNERFRTMFNGMDGVSFHSKVAREKLVELQQQSDILAYPNQPVGDFAELFGVSVAECQVAGCIPVTSDFGAFATTVIKPEGVLIVDRDGYPLHPSETEYGERFVNTIVTLLSCGNLPEIQQSVSTKARLRFNWLTIANQWLDTIDAVKQNKGIHQ